MVDKQRSRRVDDVLTVIEAVYIPFDDLNIKLIHPGLRGGGQLPLGHSNLFPDIDRISVIIPSTYSTRLSATADDIADGQAVLKRKAHST